MGTNILNWFKVIGIVLILALLGYLGYKFKSLWAKYGSAIINPFSVNNLAAQGAEGLTTALVGRAESPGTLLAEHTDDLTSRVQAINWSSGTVSEEEKQLYREKFGPLPTDPDYVKPGTPRTSEDGVLEPVMNENQIF